MEKSYKLADITNDKDIINKISRFEEELAKKMGHDVVLIAYTDKKSRLSN